MYNFVTYVGFACPCRINLSSIWSPKQHLVIEANQCIICSLYIHVTFLHICNIFKSLRYLLHPSDIYPQNYIQNTQPYLPKQAIFANQCNISLPTPHLFIWGTCHYLMLIDASRKIVITHNIKFFIVFFISSPSCRNFS